VMQGGGWGNGREAKQKLLGWGANYEREKGVHSGGRKGDETYERKGEGRVKGGGLKEFEIGVSRERREGRVMGKEEGKRARGGEGGVRNRGDTRQGGGKREKVRLEGGEEERRRRHEGRERRGRGGGGRCRQNGGKG